ncbi:hypothetical protein FSOLCH5_014842 [Fusarium solani]
MFNARSVVKSRNKEDETRCKERAAQLLVKASKQAPGVPLARQIFFFYRRTERFSPLGGTPMIPSKITHCLVDHSLLCKDHLSPASTHSFPSTATAPRHGSVPLHSPPFHGLLQALRGDQTLVDYHLVEIQGPRG